MFTLNTDGIAALQERIAEARDMVQSLVQQAVQQAGEDVVQGLSSAAPRGTGGPPPPGDEDGILAESFYVQDEAAPSESGAAISVRTKQPTKLRYVVEGRGEVLPVNKQALMWSGLDHPVRRAGPTQPNDFVTPVIDAAPDAQEVLQPIFDELSGMIGG